VREEREERRKEVRGERRKEEEEEEEEEERKKGEKKGRENKSITEALRVGQSPHTHLADTGRSGVRYSTNGGHEAFHHSG
jgi:hypothetical protein